MTDMRLAVVLLTALIACSLRAGTPPAAQLLPSDTLFVVSVPDWDKAAAFWSDSSYGRLWRDPSMKAFKEHFVDKLQAEFAGPVQRELGIKWTDYLGLLHGQVTVAVTQNGWGTRLDAKPGVLLLVDCKDQQDALKTRLSELKKKWVDAGKQLKTEQIRDVEFTTFILPATDLAPGPDKDLASDDKGASEPEDRAAPPKISEGSEITVGQSGSLLIVGNNAIDIEKVLARQAGGLAAALADQAAYDGQAALFRNAIAFAWLNFTFIYDVMARQAADSIRAGRPGNPFAVTGDRLLAATGLSGVKSAAARVTGNSEGLAAEVFLAAPQARRGGVLRVLALQPKEASPPPFVAADLVKFSRWRIDGQKAWTTLENIFTSISPDLAGLLQMGFEAAGKDRDPNFDLRKALVGNLGDDFIILQKGPRSSSLIDLNSPPTLFLIGSPNPDQLVQGMKAGTGLVPMAGGEPDLKEREFLGRKIYSLALPTLLGGNEARPKASAARQFNFAAGGGYAGMSTDAAFLEEFLRSTESNAKPLRELAGLAEAAQKVGGMGTGGFGYQNQVEVFRTWLESSQREGAAIDKLLSLAPLARGKAISPDEKRTMKEGLDISLLPPFDSIAKYFHFVVYSLGASEDGLSWKLFAPMPPKLR
jgi:hypothetical protein